MSSLFKKKFIVGSIHKNKKNQFKKHKKKQFKKHKKNTYIYTNTSSSEGENMYVDRPCPGCGKKNLIKTRPGTMGIDCTCTYCKHKIEIKQNEELFLNFNTVKKVKKNEYELPADTYVGFHQVLTDEGITEQEYRWSKKIVTEAIKRLPDDENKWRFTTEFPKPRVRLGINELGEPVVVGTIKNQNDIAYNFKFNVYPLGTRGNFIWQLDQKDLRELLIKRKQKRLDELRQHNKTIQEIFLVHSCVKHTNCDVACANCDFIKAYKQISYIQIKKKERRKSILEEKKNKWYDEDNFIDLITELSQIKI